MPSAVRYVTKDSHPTLRSLAETKTAQPIVGRRYTHAYAASHPGAIRATELALGMQYACLSITDDEPDTLHNVAKANPWQLQAMSMICDGSEEQAVQPLSTILKDRFDLTLDHCMNISGVSKAGHALDTQGYIAHNDTTIVLAYRCTTSAKDWITNLTTTSSAWEIDIDVPQGHSGYFSSCVGFGCFPCTSPDKKALNYAPPRVHTGFYNNFIVTVPIIQQYIDPLLFGPNQPPRTLYVVGHSLGAGIAVMAACYFVLEQDKYNWRTLPHKLRVVTAGGPRACCQSMSDQMDRLCHDYRYTDKVVIARLVRDKDVVPTVPPEVFGFRHLNHKLVYITKEDAETGVGQVIINPNTKQVLTKKQVRQFKEEQPDILGLQPKAHPMPQLETESSDDEESTTALDYVVAPSCLGGPNTASSDDMEVYPNALPQTPSEQEAAAAAKTAKYEKFVKCVPRAFRDHMPDFYLRPLLYLQKEEREHGQTGVGPATATGHDVPAMRSLAQAPSGGSDKPLPYYDSIHDDTESRSSGHDDGTPAVDYQPLDSHESSVASQLSTVETKVATKQGGLGRFFRKAPVR